MARSRPNANAKKNKKRKANGAQDLSPEMAIPLLEQATALLHTGQADDALSVARKALSCLSVPAATLGMKLPALELLGEIFIELGEVDEARKMFQTAADVDPEGILVGSAGGAADKFLWLAQLSEEGGLESVRWFDKGATILRRELSDFEERDLDEEEDVLQATKRSKLANALCGAAEVYMTDLSWEDDAESKCEALVTEACIVCPDSPEPLQTLASVRISQMRHDDARAALKRSLAMWSDLPPEDPLVPDFPTRISLARLLMEAVLEENALDVLERLVAEDDSSVEAWYLGGWCLHLMAQKQPAESTVTTDASVSERTRMLKTSRDWLEKCMKLYEMLDYEDERLKEHADELLLELNGVLGSKTEGDPNIEDEDDGWEDEDEHGSHDDVMDGT